MSEVILWEMQFFAKAFFLGFCLRMAYDVLLIVRKVVHHKHIWVSIEDVLFWIMCGFYVFGLLFRENSGTPRGFAIFSVIVGMLMYHLGPSKLLVPVLSKGLRMVLNGISTIIHFIWKHLKKPLLWFTIRCKKHCKRRKEKRDGKKRAKEEKSES